MSSLIVIVVAPITVPPILLGVILVRERIVQMPEEVVRQGWFALEAPLMEVIDGIAFEHMGANCVQVGSRGVYRIKPYCKALTSRASCCRPTYLGRLIRSINKKSY